MEKIENMHVYNSVASAVATPIVHDSFIPPLGIFKKDIQIIARVNVSFCQI